MSRIIFHVNNRACQNRFLSLIKTYAKVDQKKKLKFCWGGRRTRSSSSACDLHARREKRDALKREKLSTRFVSRHVWSLTLRMFHFGNLWDIEQVHIMVNE